MKVLNFYQQTYGTDNPERIFQTLLGNLKPSNMLWSYFVNWEKVFGHVDRIEWSLSLLNCLIGKPNFDLELKRLLDVHPEIISALPQLAVRITKGQKDLQQFTILVNHSNKRLEFADYDFRNYNPEQFPKYLEFLNRTGIKELLTCSKIKNLVDYMIGVEAGLDSNARKNRSGKSMELICDAFIKDWSERKGYKYICQANAKRVADQLNCDLPEEVWKLRRKYDFAAKTPTSLILFEVNFYNGAGSKLDKTASDYESHHLILKQAGIDFVWLTDGPGWLKTDWSFRHAFEAIDYVFSLDMLERGILSEEF